MKVQIFIFVYLMFSVASARPADDFPAAPPEATFGQDWPAQHVADPLSPTEWKAAEIQARAAERKADAKPGDKADAPPAAKPGQRDLNRDWRKLWDQRKREIRMQAANDPARAQRKSYNRPRPVPPIEVYMTMMARQGYMRANTPMIYTARPSR